MTVTVLHKHIVEERSDGTVIYYNLNGQLHRDNGPAVICADGTKKWFLNSTKYKESDYNIKIKEMTDPDTKLYRTYEDRIEFLHEETKQLHRLNGPARIYTYGPQKGGKEWFLNGKRHREDGAAITFANGSKQWWVDDKLHREDGPAVRCSDGEKMWFRNGVLHREDGPAWINHCQESWWQNGKYHRLDGPAIIRSIDMNHTKHWYINGIEYTKSEYKKELEKLKDIKELTVAEIESRLGHKVKIVK